MSDDLTALQQWRMTIATDVESTKKDVESIRKEQTAIHEILKNLNTAISTYNTNIELKLQANEKNIIANSRKGWVGVGASLLVGGLVLILHFGLTVGGVVAGVTSALGVVASIRKVL